MRVIALLCLVACAEVTNIRYRASRVEVAPATPARVISTVTRPPRGEAIGTTLADGFPIWVVHHADDTVSILSGVAPAIVPRGAWVPDNVANQIEHKLVSWIPGVRRFYAGGVLFDEHGQAQGFAEYGICFDSCAELSNMPLSVRDLDHYTVARDGDVLTVGELVEGGSRLRASEWLAWQRPANREEDMRAMTEPRLPRVTLAQALAMPDGHYAIVDGETMRSSHAEPVICVAAANTCGACGPDRLPLAGIAPSDAAHVHRRHWWHDPVEYRSDLRKVYTESEPGTFLVRKQGATFALVAGVFRGICGGG